MRDPYLILGVPENADDDSIHQSFIAAVKRCPPDVDPEAYDQLRQAYNTIRTRRDRLAYDLLDRDLPDPRDVLDRAFPVTPSGRPTLAQFQALLRGER